MKEQQNPSPDVMEYPFGFGFALMDDRDTLDWFFSLEDKEKREVMRAVGGIRSRQEMKDFLTSLRHRPDPLGNFSKRP